MANSRAILYHNFSIMLDAGVPLLKSLRTASEGLRGKRARAFESMVEIISKGESLAGAMAQFPKVFNRLEVMIVDAGETSGELVGAVKGLADWFSFRDRIRKIVITGLVLPVVIIHIIAFLPSLPFLLFGMISVTEYFQNAFTVLLLFYVPAVIIWGVIKFTPQEGILRNLLENLVMTIPVLGKGVLLLGLSRYAQTFHILLKAGVPAVGCAEKAAEVTGNTVVRNLVVGAAQSAHEGQLFSDGFSPQLPVEFRESWRIGEETGELDEVTKRIAEANYERAEYLVKEFCRWVPRIIYFLLIIYQALRILQAAPVLVPTV